MLTDLTLEELDALETIKGLPGWKVLQKITAKYQSHLLDETFRVQERHIQNGNVTIIESVVGQIQRNAGKSDGAAYVLSAIELSTKRRLYVQDHEKEQTVR